MLVKEDSRHRNFRFVASMLIVAAAILMFSSLFVKMEKEANLVRLIGYNFLVGVGIMRFFRSRFKDKPTRADYEKKNFGN